MEEFKLANHGFRQRWYPRGAGDLASGWTVEESLAGPHTSLRTCSGATQLVHPRRVSALPRIRGILLHVPPR